MKYVKLDNFYCLRCNPWSISGPVSAYLATWKQPVEGLQIACKIVESLYKIVLVSCNIVYLFKKLFSLRYVSNGIP